MSPHSSRWALTRFNFRSFFSASSKLSIRLYNFPYVWVILQQNRAHFPHIPKNVTSNFEDKSFPPDSDDIEPSKNKQTNKQQKKSYKRKEKEDQQEKH